MRFFLHSWIKAEASWNYGGPVLLNNICSARRQHKLQLSSHKFCHQLLEYWFHWHHLKKVQRNQAPPPGAAVPRIVRFCRHSEDQNGTLVCFCDSSLRFLSVCPLQTNTCTEGFRGWFKGAVHAQSFLVHHWASWAQTVGMIYCRLHRCSPRCRSFLSHIDKVMALHSGEQGSADKNSQRAQCSVLPDVPCWCLRHHMYISGPPARTYKGKTGPHEVQANHAICSVCSMIFRVYHLILIFIRLPGMGHQSHWWVSSHGWLAAARNAFLTRTPSSALNPVRGSWFLLLKLVVPCFIFNSCRM